MATPTIIAVQVVIVIMFVIVVVTVVVVVIAEHSRCTQKTLLDHLQQSEEKQCTGDTNNQWRLIPNIAVAPRRHWTISDKIHLLLATPIIIAKQVVVA